VDLAIVQRSVDEYWEQSILPQLIEYIRIPNKSPAFDSDWQSKGHVEQAARLIESWCRAQPIEDLKVDVLRLPGRTPLLYLEAPGEGDDCVLLYGHFDKQPEMTGWREGLGPWEPVLEGDRLYGRGGADDGYAAFASVTAIRVLQEQRVRHARCVVLIEGCEESGSYDLPHYIEHLRDRIGRPSLVVCLDSGCGNYDQLWCTTSLRGMVSGTLRVQILDEGVHSGDASGIVPSSFRIARQLLSRLEDESTGRILPETFQVEIPAARQKQAAVCADALGATVHDRFPFPPGAHALTRDPVEAILNRTWRPTLAVTGAGGLPRLSDAGSVLLPYTELKLSMRLPPTCDPDAATRAMKQRLEHSPPYGARVTFEADAQAAGWNAPPLAAWLEASMERASQALWGRRALYMGEGGTIPFMGMLGERFPDAQFIVTGVLGPQSNAHGPNEFLHLPTARKLTCAVAQVLTDHHRSHAA